MKILYETGQDGVCDRDNSDNIYCQVKVKIKVLPPNFWGGESRQPDLLAAFVKPNGQYVESLVRQVSLYMEKEGHGRKIDGYYSNTREKPYLMAALLWDAIFSQKISYVTPPSSYATLGQRRNLYS